MKKKSNRKGTRDKYAILSMGALGDTILHYYRVDGIFGQIASYKRENPGSKIKVICCSSNQQTHELFKENPNIYRVHHIPWALQGRGIEERNAIYPNPSIHQCYWRDYRGGICSYYRHYD
jgi:hypothetical protein